MTNSSEKQIQPLQLNPAQPLSVWEKWGIEGQTGEKGTLLQ